MKVTALAGGVGGAKLIKGLAQIMPHSELTVIVNTGDDFEYYGLNISPDIDSVVYALADLVDSKLGYGRANDSFTCFDTLSEFGENPWFRLGDKDIALQLQRTSLLKSGKLLSETTREICLRLGVNVKIIPMTDSNVFTTIGTKEMGELTFQEYFVKYCFEPEILSIKYRNCQSATLSGPALSAISDADLVVISPSNPWLSIFPILSIPKVEQLISQKCVIAVSPIISGKAIKGPAAKIFSELGKKPSATGVAELYQDWLDGIVIDNSDENERQMIESLGIKVALTDIMMRDINDKTRVAEKVLDFAKLVI